MVGRQERTEGSRLTPLSSLAWAMLPGAVPEYRLVVVPSFARRIAAAVAFAVIAVALTSVLELRCLMADRESDSCCPTKAAFVSHGCSCMAPGGPEIVTSEQARYAVRDDAPPMVAVLLVESRVDIRVGVVSLRFESDSPPESPPLSTLHQILRV